VKALIIEDSRLARQGLARMLENFPNIEVIGAAENADLAFEEIEKKRPELLFLDIHMPGASGFELLANLDYEPKIIFTTAYSDYAIKSFDYNTVDYLLKPISHERLKSAIDKLESQQPESSSPEAKLDLNSRIFLKDADQCHLVEIAEIRYIESCKNYVRIFYKDQKPFLKKSLNQIETRLPERHFFKASRQFIINLQAISAIDEAIGDGYDVTMNDNKVIHVSRRNATRMKELLSF
jgi:two-component system LytT family response regulator